MNEGMMKSTEVKSRIAKLGAYVAKAKALDPRKFPEEEFELFSVPSHAEGKPEVVLGKTVGASKQAVEDDTVLLCKINPRINRTWVVSSHTGHRKIASSEWMTFPPSPDFLPKYLGYYLQQDELRDHLALNASGVGGSLMRAKPGLVKDYPFPLFPLPEQRRIVSAIETQLGRLDAAVARLHAAKAKLKRYKQAVLKAAVEGAFLYPDLERDELPMGWKAASLGELVEDPKYGTSKKCSADEKGVPVLRIPNIGDGVVSHADLKYASFDAKERKAYALRAGDLLTIRSNGSVDLVGKCALIREEDEHCLYAGYLIRLRPKHDTVESRYLLYHLSSFPSRVEIESKAKSTSGVNNINAQELKDLTIILPPLKDQIAICDTVDVLMSEMNSLDTAIDAQLLQASRLRQAVLKRAFEGRLV